MKDKTVYLEWDDSTLKITNSFPKLEKILEYTHKSLEKQGWQSKTVRRQVKLFNILVDTKEVRIIVTFQGMLDIVIQGCIKSGYLFKMIDKRGHFPQGKLADMSGFRFTQQELTEKFILSDRSGILEAPTRYGKSRIIANVIKAYRGLKMVFCAPGVDLLKQTQRDFEELLPELDIRGIYTGSKGKSQSDDLTLCSLDSVHHCNKENTELLLVDEVHTSVTAGRFPALNEFKNARKLGFSATTEGRFDGSDILLTGLFGPILARRTYPEAVAEGAILPLKCFILNVPFKVEMVGTRDAAYNKLVYQNAAFKQLVADICNEVTPQDWQTLVFIKNEKQAEFLEPVIEDSIIAMAKRLKAKERDALFKKMQDGSITRCIASDIYSTGVTFPDLRMQVNCSLGGGSILAIQKPGRLLQVRPGKTYGYMVDFNFVPDRELSRSNCMSNVVYDCEARFNIYRKKGYQLDFVDSIKDIDLI